MDHEETPAHRRQEPPRRGGGVHQGRAPAPVPQVEVVPVPPATDEEDEA